MAGQNGAVRICAIASGGAPVTAMNRSAAAVVLVDRVVLGQTGRQRLGGEAVAERPDHEHQRRSSPGSVVGDLGTVGGLNVWHGCSFFPVCQDRPRSEPLLSSSGLRKIGAWRSVE
jgi:hypothetical protein